MPAASKHCRLVFAVLAALGVLSSACSDPSSEPLPAFHQAAQFCDVAEVEALIGETSDIDETANGWTALMLATAGGGTGDDCPKTVELLINAGADPTAISDQGLGLFQFAASAGNPEVVTILTQTSADPCRFEPITRIPRATSVSQFASLDGAPRDVVDALKLAEEQC